MKIDKNTTKALGITLASALALTLIPELSLAEGDTTSGGPFGSRLCDIAGWFTGDTGRAIATVAVVFLGIAAFFGKVTWGLALMFAVGIFAIFGASDIIKAVSSGEGCTAGA